MRDAEPAGHMFAQRLYAVAFGRMMAAREIGRAAFPRQMNGGLGDFAAEINGCAGGNGVAQHVLRRSGAPADATDRLLPIADDERGATKARLHQLCQLGNGAHAGVGGDAQPADIVFAKASVRLQVELTRQLDVVTELRVTIERQVVGEEVHVVRQQNFQALVLGRHHARVFAAPEVTVMHEDRIGARSHRRFEQGQARGHAGDECPDPRAALHLQAIWAIIAEAGNIERLREVARQLVPIDEFLIHFHIILMRRFWLLFAQTVTIGLALWFIVASLKPEWVGRALSGAQRAASPIEMLEAPANMTPAQGSYRDAAQRAMPAVVNIYTTKEARQPKSPFMDDPLFKRFFGEQQEERQFSLGSGVIMSTEGYVLTNNHVVETADEIEVALADGRKVAAKVVGTDPETDLAILKINLKDLPAITLGHIEETKVGDVVLAIGNPFGVGQTVTMGIVSALGRSHLGINTFENFIQTDAAINPGNSGGALIDTHGNLLGINTAIYSRSGGSLGIGFAIPVSTVKRVMESIISTGSVVYGWIGVEPQDITPELAESFGLSRKSGAIIAGVLKNGPADKAGMKPGDILVAVEGKPVEDTTDMLNLVAQLTPGNKAKLTVLRKNQETTLDILVGKRPKPQRQAVDNDSDNE